MTVLALHARPLRVDQTDGEIGEERWLHVERRRSFRMRERLERFGRISIAASAASGR
jgi:hypothetical protein